MNTAHRPRLTVSLLCLVIGLLALNPNPVLSEATLQAGNAEDIQRAYDQAMLGDTDAQYFLFKSYRSGVGVGHSVTDAIRWLSSAANGGHAEAQFWLGHITFFGNGIARDVESAVQLFTKSAKQDFVPAQVRLGQIYNGWRYRFYPSNPGLASKWYYRAAEHGHMQSMYIVGCKNYFGIDQETDLDEGIAWFNKAAALGDKSATNLLRDNNQAGLRLFCERVTRI